jgi:hypothetical protein
MKLLLKKVFEQCVQIYLVAVLMWVFVALSFDFYMIYLEFSGQQKKALSISTSLWKKLDYKYR